MYHIQIDVISICIYVYISMYICIDKDMDAYIPAAIYFYPRSSLRQLGRLEEAGSSCPELARAQPKNSYLSY